MSQNPAAAEGTGEDCQIYQRLPTLAPPERTQAVLQLIGEHPQQRLELPNRDGARAVLDGIDLSRQGTEAIRSGSAQPVPWWNVERQTIDLRRADLRGASLRRATFARALLEEARFTGADLAGANFREAVLAEVDFRGAMLEEADLQGASLRFARLHDAILEGAKLRRADLWGVQGAGAVLVGADLRGATLTEANLEGADLRQADLRGAVLKQANLRGANLQGADLQDAVLGGTDLEGAVLQEARLQGVILSHCRIAGAHLSDAWLERTRLQREQLGGAIGEERAHEYEMARRGYLALERNFETLGDPDAARWAYLKKRRMQKRDARRRARAAVHHRHWGAALRWYVQYRSDQFVEWLCDYGESVWRVFGTLLTVYLLFFFIYAVTGTVVRVEQTPNGTVRTPTDNPADLALFSLTAMTSPGNPPDWLLPANNVGYLLTGFQALLSIFLTGLLGFVAGNRIRR